jgi:squalene-associated FAD-dependent desaturase
MKRCVVAGGGLAGLAAALRLSASPDMSVTLCESAPAPGGRVRSFVDRASGDEIDNGQHVLMGCYRATLRYLAEAGLTDPSLLRMRGFVLPFVHADGRHSVLQAGGLPHPLSLVQALLRYDMLPFGARLRILRMVMRLRFQTERAWKAADVKNAAAWLRECGQREKEIEHFWRPIILATMNTEAESASAKLFSTVLREIFLGEPDAADMLLPATALSTLFVDPAREELERRGVRILTGTAVSAVETVAEQTPAANDRRGGRVTAVRCGALRRPADAVILAVPPWVLSRIVLLCGMESGGADLTQCIEELLPGTELAAFTPSEILSLHVWIRRSLGDSPMTGLLGTSVQWVFFKGRTSEGLFHYSCTISSARGDETGDRAALRALLLRELRLLDAGLCDDDIARILPIREKRATFIPRPGLEGHRPVTRTSVPGLFLAGDWTATGLPATIEGAIRSGFAAADSVLRE